MTNKVRPIKSPEDLQGLKMRVASPMFVDIMNDLGANPQQIQWTEVFGALQQGVVDGQENPIGSVIVPSRIYEVQDYITLWHYSYDPVFLLMSLQKWEAMSPEQQEAIQAAADEAMAFQKELTRTETADGIATLEENGVEVYEPSDAEIERFREATETSFETWSAKLDPELLGSFQNVEGSRVATGSQ